MMRERGQQHVVVGTNAQLLGETLRRILLAPVGELLGTRPQIGVQNAVQPVLPSGRERLVRIFHHGVDIRLDDRIQLAVHMPVGSVTQAGINLLGHDAVTVDDIHHVVQRASAAQIGAAVHADIAARLVQIGVVNDEHFGQVDRLFALAEHFGLDERYAGIVPAGAGVGLVLDRGCGVVLDGGKAELGFPFFLLFGQGVVEGQQQRQEHQGKERKEVVLIHSDRLFCFLSS